MAQGAQCYLCIDLLSVKKGVNYGQSYRRTCKINPRGWT